MTMTEKREKKTTKRKYPRPWNVLIPAAVILISGVITYLVFITIRVALGLSAF